MAYADFYKTAFGKKVLEKELVYVMRELSGFERVISIGSGPCVLEAGLQQVFGKKMVCLDSSREMLEECPGFMETALGDAENMSFGEGEFDAALFVTSLEFVEDAGRALDEAKRVVRKEGKVLALVLNPESGYFREKSEKKESYFNKIRHKSLEKLSENFKKRFNGVEGEYFLGIQGEKVFESEDREKAAIFAIKGTK